MALITESWTALSAGIFHLLFYISSYLHWKPEWKAELWRIYIADVQLRGKGLGKEAMLGIMDYCFNHLGLERLYLDHYTGNPAAYLYQSLGFKYEGVLRKNCRKNGVLYDVHLMSMLREEYEELYRKA